MKILFLSPYPPYPPRSGGATRIYNLLLGLAQRHDVCCLTFVPSGSAAAALEPLRASCKVEIVEGVPQRSMLRRAWTTLASRKPDMALRNASKAYSKALRQLLRTDYFDMVHAESIEMAGYGLQAAPYARIVLDQFNAEYVLQRRAALTELQQSVTHPSALAGMAYSLMQWRKLARYERTMLRYYDHVLAVSEQDRRALLQLNHRARVDIVPNGVDTSFFAPQAVPDNPAEDTPAYIAANAIVFTGALDYRPNIDAVLWFARMVLPLVWANYPDVRFVIVGRSPSPAIYDIHDGEKVIVRRDVEDVRPYIAASAVYVVPMRMGGGVRLKLLEALSMQAAVVSTSMGAEGVKGLQDGTHLLMANTPTTFAESIIRLIEDTELARQLGTAGRALAAAQYDWQVIVPRLEQVYTR
jgi:sugar transferase (PEP-CTERM/EpsH1 system associated)